MQGWARRDGSHRRARGLAAAENRGALEGLPRRSSRCASAQPHRWGSADEVPRPGLPARATPRLSRRSSSGKRYVGVVSGRSTRAAHATGARFPASTVVGRERAFALVPESAVRGSRRRFQRDVPLVRPAFGRGDRVKGEKPTARTVGVARSTNVRASSLQPRDNVPVGYLSRPQRFRAPEWRPGRPDAVGLPRRAAPCGHRR